MTANRDAVVILGGLLICVNVIIFSVVGITKFFSKDCLYAKGEILTHKLGHKGVVSGCHGVSIKVRVKYKKDLQYWKPFEIK